jgi:hypothetical protein
MKEERRGVLVGIPEEKRPRGRPRRKWKDGIRMDLGRLAGLYRVDPVGSKWGPVTSSCKYGDVLTGSGATDLVS